MANLALICDDIRWWLAQITHANGYATNVRTVAAQYASFDEVRSQRGDVMPWLAAFPANSSPPPVLEFGSRGEEFADVTIVGHVGGDDDDLRAFDLTVLEEEIHRVLQVDTTRDGWAVQTVKHVGQANDIGVPKKGGMHGDTNTLVTGVRCSYYPDDDAARYRVSHAELYAASADYAVITTINEWLQAGGTWSVPNLAMVDFEQPTAGEPTLRYTGKRTKLFRFEASVNPFAAAGGPAAGIQHRASSSDAWTDPAAYTQKGRDGGVNEYMLVHGVFELVEGAELRLAVTNMVSTDNVITFGSIIVTQVPRF